MPIIAAWTVSRCDASMLIWIVAFTFEAAGRLAALAAGRLRVFPFPASDDSGMLPPLRLDALPCRRFATQAYRYKSRSPSFFLVSATPLPCLIRTTIGRGGN